MIHVCVLEKLSVCVCVCEFTFIVIVGVTRRKAKVVLEVSPLIQHPGWSVSYTDAVLIH